MLSIKLGTVTPRNSGATRTRHDVALPGKRLSYEGLSSF